MSGADPLGDTSATTAAVEAVRRNPQWYFPSGVFEADLAIGMVAAEAVSHGARDIAVVRCDSWWVIASTHDWLQGTIGVFTAMTPDPLRGDNAARVEIALTAFCRRVISTRSGIVEDIVGLGAPPASAQRILDDPVYERVIAFLPPEAPEHEQAGSAAPGLAVVQAGELASAVDQFDDKARRYLSAERIA